ncbi:6150_t:CDS:2, partial [Funneliformis geosporum]
MKVRNLLSADFASLYPSLIMTYNFSSDKIILFREYAESLKESAEMKGLYPKVLEELLIKRNSLKRRLTLLNDRKKELEKEITLAGGITSVGQRNIKLIADLVRSKRFSVKYWDTDSLYLICPEECFQKCDETYDNRNGISKDEYWSRIVNISIEVIKRLRDEVNDFLRNDNGSSYLKMAYEEVLFPVRKQSKHFREVGKKVMNESMKVDNSRTLYQIVKDMLKEIIKDISQIDLNGMIKTAM